MKKITMIFSFILFLASCSNKVYVYSSFHEPATEGLRYLWSKDGLHWDSIPGVWLKPEVGLQKVMRDPSILSTPDGVFHLVWTSSWKKDLGFGYAESRDLQHWSKERFITVMNDTNTVNVWAPELFYDSKRKETMIIWASCVPGKFTDGTEDPDNNHRLYYTTTKDFKTFSETQLLLDPGFSCIDAMVIKYGKRKFAMVLKDNTRQNRNLKVVLASDPHGPWSPASSPFTKTFSEGPSVAEIRNGYVIYYDRYRDKDFGASFTRDFRSFEDFSNRISVPKGHKHGTIFKVPKCVVDNMLKKVYKK